MLLSYHNEIYIPTYKLNGTVAYVINRYFIIGIGIAEVYNWNEYLYKTIVDGRKKLCEMKIRTKRSRRYAVTAPQEYKEIHCSTTMDLIAMMLY